MPLKSVIRQKILEIGGKITAEPNNPNFNFIFQFEYGKRNFSVSKPKKRQIIGITHAFHFDKNHKKVLDEILKDQKKIRKFLINFTNILHYFRMDFNFNLKENRVVITTKIFIERNEISTNILYEKFMQLFSCNKVLLNFIHENLEDNGFEIKSTMDGTPPSGIYS